MIDFFAGLPHYLDHVAPIWWALTPDERGTFYAGRHAADRAAAEGIWPVTVGRPPSSATPTVVASYADLKAIGRRSAIFVEHGAGQTYNGDPRGRQDPSYSGGRDRDAVRLFLAPNEAVHHRNLESTPGAASALIGTPKLDWWQRAPRDTSRAPTVAVSFHWDCTLLPETRGAWPYFDGALQALVITARARGWQLLGHGHPRLWARISRRWTQLGVEAVPDFGDVLRRADLYVVDNSSTLFEFAATAGPVVVLNAPWFRRDVHHGLRFWDAAAVGVNVDEPEALTDGIAEALADPPIQRATRRALTHPIYPLLDGQAAQRAADAIRAHLL